MVDPNVLHHCQCHDCRRSAASDIADEHRAINRVLASLNEKARRLFAGVLAIQYGRGGIERVVEITGLSRNTIRRGRRELQNAASKEGRIRRPGGGRLRVEKKVPPS